MADIPNQRLEDAERSLRSIAEKPSGFRTSDIDWAVVREQLSRLETATRQNDAVIFEEAYSRLKNRFRPANVLRGEIGPEPEGRSAVLPPEVFELLNHIVDTLHLELNKRSPEKQKQE